ncbi:2-oxoacid:ferredoxin oxidoreductase, delta subunit [Desulfitobacterium dichloroeliminans LMG P-21439]|uniref:2-oxoacid:ferredoxin oxidoreductase, delta subunit n=1 Tax=Desulfitobacterium dichloroeliminans (strain LMG P-21439 / DCA1) TaxID=871963 RepID=L0F6Z8_DESDL|nr:4Fe-4S dicluster domain-containing protein [Desulfitobacterium dichloroeliminans]AGA68962.1 2-oxoacid:ferredoxin oxidoreductase, delta subunit [Desulfitobacterium dichloroeliminans LMG P-21439]
MGHITSKDAYKNLEERINWFTHGAPPSASLYAILQVLYTETEARRVALLPVRPFTAKQAAKIWSISEGKAEAFLEGLCQKALLVDSFYNGVRQFVMPPPMAGFIEFALMRTRGDIDQKYLSELYYQYMNVEEDFVKDLFFATETRLGRVYVQEPMLTNANTIHILDYERASHIIEDATHIGLGMCYCRHKMSHVDQPCAIDAPWDVCLTFGNVARSLAEHGQHARLIDRQEAMDVLERSYAANLVQIGENVRETPAFICNCCGCCCEALQAARKFSPMQPVATTNYIPKISEECIGCGQCEKVCPVLAISMSKNTEGKKVAQVDHEVCLGCGICVRSCSRNSIELVRREVQIITPVNSTHRFVLQAIEKGTLQNLIFDNQAFANHRAMAAVLGVILKLPPLKQMGASKQFKSIYLDKMLSSKSKQN